MRPSLLSSNLLYAWATALSFSGMGAFAFHLVARPAFTFSTRMRTTTKPLFVTRDEYFQPHFEVLEQPHKTYDFDFERILECAKSTSGECPIEEMTQMMEELERLDAKSPEGGRQTVYHALQSQVELAAARNELEALGDLAIATANADADILPHQSPSDVQNLMRQMRDIAEHEEH